MVFSFCSKKAFNLAEVQFIYVFLSLLVLSYHIQGTTPNPRPKTFTSVLSSKIFKVLALTIRPFILLYVDMHHLLKRLILSTLNCLDILVKKLIHHECEGFFLDSQFYSIDLCVSDILKK